MENIKSIEQTFDNKEFSSVKIQRKSPLFSLVLFCVSIGSFALNSILKFESDSSMPSFLIITGLLLLIWAIVSFSFRKNEYSAVQSNMKLKAHELLIDTKEKEKLVQIMQTKNYSAIKNLKRSTHDGLKLRYYATNDFDLCFSQIVFFAQSEYVNINNVQQHIVGDGFKDII